MYETLNSCRWRTIAIALVLVAAMADAQDNAQLVNDRQKIMKAQGIDNKTVNDYAKGRVPKAAAEKAIANLQASSDMMLGLFSESSTSSAAMPGVSNAKANIWTEREKFEVFVAQLKVLADKQADLITSGTPVAVGIAQAELGKSTCSGCHDVFREPR